MALKTIRDGNIAVGNYPCPIMTAELQTFLFARQPSMQTGTLYTTLPLEL